MGSLVSAFPDVMLDIYGAATDRQYAEQLQEQASAFAEYVAFHGPATQAEIKQAFGRSQALVLTSHEEHAPVIVAEAMASGRPVVATAVGALADMVEPGQTGFLAERGDAGGIAAHVATLLANPDLAAEMGAEAGRRARARFHPQVVGDGYLAALQAAMAGD